MGHGGALARAGRVGVEDERGGAAVAAVAGGCCGLGEILGLQEVGDVPGVGASGHVVDLHEAQYRWIRLLWWWYERKKR